VLSEQVEDYEHEIQCLKKDVVEMEELEKKRSERTNCFENELHLARGTLLEATLAAAEAESTVTSLNSVIEELPKENELLHSQIHEMRDSVNKELAKQNEALTAAEKEVHKWKLKCEEEQETNRS
jgi:predicted  nucleic acid-binding Zn-ribbon protein